MTNTAITAAEVSTVVEKVETLSCCANPKCDKTFKPRSNKRCCSPACRLIVLRASPAFIVNNDADKVVRAARKKSREAQLLRVRNHDKAQRRNVHETFSTASCESFRTEKMHGKIVSRDKLVAHYGGDGIPSGILPPHTRYGASGESISTIPLYTFETDELRREKAYEQFTAKQAQKVAAAKKLEDDYKHSVVKDLPDTPVTFSCDVTKPHGTPMRLRIDENDGELQVAVNISGRTSFLSAHLPPSPVTELLPTTGREAPSYLASENENVTTVIPAVKKKRVKKAV